MTRIIGNIEDNITGLTKCQNNLQITGKQMLRVGQYLPRRLVIILNRKSILCEVVCFSTIKKFMSHSTHQVEEGITVTNCYWKSIPKLNPSSKTRKAP